MGIVTRTNGTAPPEVPLADVRLGTWDFWALNDDLRDGAFATLRREAPISFWPEPVQEGFQSGDGHWALTSLDDVFYASRHPEIFSSSPNITINDQTPEVSEYFGSMIVLDDPRHQRLRSIVSRAFTPKVVARIEASVRERARRLVASLIANHPNGEADLVSELAGPLPLQIICDMMGIPGDQYDMVLANSNIILSGADPEFLSEDQDEAVTRLLGAGQALADLVTGLAADRTQAQPGAPAEDLVSALVTANIDGEQLTSAELASFFILLVVAGNETTRTALSHALMLFTEFPDQRTLLLADTDGRIEGAVEEIVRSSSPVTFMRRTLTQDYAMNGQSYRKGDKVVLYYYSANRDEAVFADAERFDITRSPNPHVGYGAAGPHICLGAHLARRELTVMLRELLTRVPDITAGEPDRLLSSFVNGIKRLPCQFSG